MSFKPQLTAHTLHINLATAPARYARKCLALMMAAALISVGLLNTAQALTTTQGLDPTFGTGGRVMTDFSGKTDVANSIALQPDGKIVLAGMSDGDFALARYNTDGSLDDGTANDLTPGDSFGTNGKVTTDFLGFADAAAKVVLQSDGKIIAAGYASDSAQNGGMHFSPARYNTDGSLDDGTASDSTPA